MKAVGDIRLVDGLSTVRLYVQNEPACATTFRQYYRPKKPAGQENCDIILAQRHSIVNRPQSIHTR